MGEDSSVGTVFLYAAILAYSACNLPIAIPEIASQHRRANLPILWSLSMSFFVKWLIGMVGSIALLNVRSQANTVIANAYLIGASLYCLLILVPQVVSC